MARALGFDNINMDLIMGLPGEDLDDVKHTLEEIEALKPDSFYCSFSCDQTCCKT